jgi:endoglucanase
VDKGWLRVVALPLAVAGCHAATPAAETSPADASDASVRDSPDAQDETDSADGSSDMNVIDDAGMDAPDGRAAVNAGADAADAYASDASIDAASPLPALPLETTSRWIVDSNGKRFKLASVNWYGAEEKDFVVAGLDFQDVHTIARAIRALGFNAVRLPFSNELVETDPVIADARLAANPSLLGETALAVMDAVIDALAEEGLVVILDDHMSDADWCCSTTDGNGLWYNAAYPESSWIADWRTMATRYLSQPAVVGADLRNELRASDAGTPTWGGSDSTLDWHGAAERGGNAVLGVNPNLLVIVEGLNYSNDLTGAYSLPVVLPVANRLVYSPHDYAFDHPSGVSASDLATDLGDEWGYILNQGQSYTAPIWVGEFGTCNTSASCVSGASDQGGWFAGFAAYLNDADIDWAYWAINGTEASGTGRTLGAPETYGVLDVTWTTSASPALTSALQSLQPATQGP